MKCLFLIAQDVCAEVAAGLGISPVALDFFTLVSEDHRHLLDPSKRLTESDCNSRYHFKLCFKACCAATLREFDRNAHDYYFHQVSSRFLSKLNELGAMFHEKHTIRDFKFFFCKFMKFAREFVLARNSIHFQPSLGWWSASVCVVKHLVLN